MGAATPPRFGVVPSACGNEAGKARRKRLRSRLSTNLERLGASVITRHTGARRQGERAGTRRRSQGKPCTRIP